MTATILNRRDVDFLLFDWLRADALCARDRYAAHDRTGLEALMELSAELAERAFLPHWKQSDREEPVLENGVVRALPAIRPALREFADAGLFGAPFDVALGGSQVPQLVNIASLAWFMAANVATAAYPMLTIANARLLATFGTQSQIDTFAKPQIAGEWLGTMCLSEPQAGSSLGDITTRATPDGADKLGDRYRLRGSKMWISGGDHDLSGNIVHLVLAKIPDADGTLPEGTRGISLFVVPKILPDGTRNDIAVAGLNHKMGYRGTTNCLLAIGENGGATGWRVGGAGQGLACMFQMMNEARIAVGLGAAALGYRGYLLAKDYALQRPQGRLPGQRGSAMAPIIAHADVKRMLLAQKAYAEGALSLVLYCARLVDDEQTAETEAARAEAASTLSLLTPVAKTWPSEYGLAANDLAIQVHGGYGYTRDFDVEQLYRDNRLNPIHEGTTGIQAIDLVGRKIRRDKLESLTLLMARVHATSERAQQVSGLASLGRRLNEEWARIHSTARVRCTIEDDAEALAAATPFLSAFGHAVVAWLWLDQLLAMENQPEDFRHGKLHACRYFYACELPRVAEWLAFVVSRSNVYTAMQPDWF
jgi:alkylation response protein AidB-like acyl-CoA dehydrogenase